MKAVTRYVEALGKFAKADGGGWTSYDAVYKTQHEWKARMYAEPSYATKVRKFVVGTLMSTGEMMSPDDQADG